MKWLETRIPPPLVALLFAFAMWLIDRSTPDLGIPDVARLVLGGLVLALGLACSTAGMKAFRRADTTVNPLHPEKASALVTNGLFARTRNPMYLGLTIDLVAVAIFMASPAALVAVPVFMLYIYRFQIVPEERAVLQLFGEEYRQYRQRVRRWL
jgi:protein-S-isoprenylcysteine O-methyltransferase Ste14